MELRDLEFELPQKLIAQQPASPRDQARLFVYNRATGAITHRRVADLIEYLPAGSLIVANNSKVRRARLYAKNSSGKRYEVLVLEPLAGNDYRCLIGGHKIEREPNLQFYTHQEGTQLIPLTGIVTEREEGVGMNTFRITFQSETNQSVETLFAQYGSVPLPPYISPGGITEEQYQTIYAKELGSAAAPTAGLHFTPELINSLKKRGTDWEEVTLHVGMGTFLPLREAKVEDNKLHQETTFISPETARVIEQKRAEKQRIMAVGTTTTRTLESHVDRNGQLNPGEQATSLFIYPGYHFKTVNTLLTNFHLPHSSLLLLVAAFLGNTAEGTVSNLTQAQMIEKLMTLYRTAIAEEYRFFSFGDAMLIL